MSKIHRPISRSGIKPKVRNKIKVQMYKTIIAVLFLIAIIVTKNINSKVTNNFINIVKKGVTYKFDIVEDSKRIFNGSQIFVKDSIESILVFNQESEYISPIQGDVFRSFDQEVRVGNSIIKNNGLDIMVKSDKNPISIINGVIESTEQRGNKGYYVSVVNEEIKVVYGYLSKIYVTNGESVEVGTDIGEIGTNKDGNKYLRLEIYKNDKSVDPLKYFDLESFN